MEVLRFFGERLLKIAQLLFRDAPKSLDFVRLFLRIINEPNNLLPCFLRLKFGLVAGQA